MSDTKCGQRVQHLSPLILRLGMAAVLAGYGASQIGGTARPEDSVAASQVAHAALTGDHSTLAGLGALGTAALLGVGLLTRLASVGLLGTIAFGAYQVTFGTHGWVLGNSPAGLYAGHRGTMLLLAAVALSLLTSGAGCVSFDGALARRRKAKTTLLT